MEITNKNIEEYIHRFMEGETTNAEEQAIYRFFQEGDIPTHLKPYSDMFAWYEEGMPEEKLPKPMPQPIWKRIPFQVRSMGIAAILVVAIGLGIMLSFNNNNHVDVMGSTRTYFSTTHCDVTCSTANNNIIV